MVDYIVNNMWQFWAVIAVVCLILELSAGDFFITCFAIGAIGAAIVSSFGGIGWQLLVFVVVTALSVFYVRPFALKYLHRKGEDRVSNADALMGRIGRVSQQIDKGGYGRVAIDGDDWKSVSVDGQAIEDGASVRVVGRDSIILTVEKV